MKLPAKQRNFFVKVASFRRQIAKARDVASVAKICIAIDILEDAMKKAGYATDLANIRPANEARFEARWKLGQLLAKVERDRPGPRRRDSSRAENQLPKKANVLKDIGLDKTRASEAERIGAIPSESLLRKAFAEAEKNNVLNTVKGLLDFARPYWHQAKRKATHKRIRSEAAAVNAEAPDKFGPFPLIYADPPWIFETHTPDMTHRMPDDHYPTMTDAEIIDFTMFGKTVRDIAAKDAALFMWCTSSNLVRALEVLDGWGFEYKTQAVWDKCKIGLGLIFRNQHEVLLYGSRGNPPKPVQLFSSVMRFPRTKHSVKPSEVRDMLEKMYPFFEEQTRIELFARGIKGNGWTNVGYEAKANAAAKVA